MTHDYRRSSSQKFQLATEIFAICKTIHERYLNAVIELADRNDQKSLEAASQALKNLTDNEDKHGA